MCSLSCYVKAFKYFWNIIICSSVTLCHLCTGCKLGEASDFIVRQGTLIQVPSSAGDVGCYKICTCGQSGLLENCMELHCVDLQKSCIVGGERKGMYCCRLLSSDISLFSGSIRKGI